MKTITTIKGLHRQLLIDEEQKIGFVPTMGFLHEGHLSLAEKAGVENDLVVMSIFVNPLQFGPNEDFDRYPRDEAKDREKAEKAGVDILFIPTVEEMYPTKQKLAMSFTEGADVLCGRSRPTHFSGVATVLSKLFHLVSPDRAYFGLKDAQQFALVNTLVEQLNFRIDLIGLSTVREADGLAKSSRNVYLNEAERQEAPLLQESLEKGRQSIVEGMTDPRKVEKEIRTSIQNQMPHASIDYVEVLQYPSLGEVSEIDSQMIIAAAIHYTKARLIDNIILLPTGEKQDKITMYHKTKK